MEILAKYAGTCPKCNGPFAVGDRVEWVKGIKPRHIVCPEVRAVTPPPRPSNSRCPNPSDCGDPGCDGNCGY
jgi:hypothetical protein